MEPTKPSFDQWIGLSLTNLSVFKTQFCEFGLSLMSLGFVVVVVVVVVALASEGCGLINITGISKDSINT